MNLTRRALVAGSLALPFVSPGLTTAAPAPRAKWTVMVYMSGDNNLENYVVKDLERELAATGSTPTVQVVALADRIPGRDNSRGNWSTTKLFHVTKGMKATAANAVADWGERDFGKPETLLRFVQWAKTNYPAERYALYLWGHSWNWHPGYTMEDETSHDTLNPREIASIRRKLAPLAVVGYDSCNAASIEVQAMWRGVADTVAASEEFVNWDGLGYDRIIAALNANPDLTTDEAATATSQSATNTKERTWSAVALDQRWDTLETAVDRWARALNAGLKKNRAAYDKALKATQSFAAAPMDCDLYDFASEVNKRVSDAAIKQAGIAVMNAVENAVIDEWHKPMYTGAHGITIFIPAGSMENPNATYYRSLDFAKSTAWDEFLKAWIK